MIPGHETRVKGFQTPTSGMAKLPKKTSTRKANTLTANSLRRTRNWLRGRRIFFTNNNTRWSGELCNHKAYICAQTIFYMLTRSRIVKYKACKHSSALLSSNKQFKTARSKDFNSCHNESKSVVWKEYSRNTKEYSHKTTEKFFIFGHGSGYYPMLLWRTSTE